MLIYCVKLDHALYSINYGSYNHRRLFWPVYQIDIQHIMHGFLVDGHIHVIIIQLSSM